MAEHLVTCRQPAPELNGSDAVRLQIHNRLALDAHEMVMAVQVGFQQQRSVMDCDLTEQPGREKSVNVFVDGSERNGGYPPFHALINLFRRRMAMGFEHCPENRLALMRERQTCVPAPLPELLEPVFEIRHHLDNYY